MKICRRKFYAHYSNVSDWEFLSGRKLLKALIAIHNDGNDWRQFASCFNEYDSKIEANRYLQMHLRGDRDEAIESLKSLRVAFKAIKKANI